MGEGEGRLTNGRDRGDAGALVVRFEREADLLRADLDGLLAELRRRGQQALSLRGQVRRHPALFVVAAAALVGLLCVKIVRARARRESQRALRVRLRRAFRSLFAAQPPPVP